MATKDANAVAQEQVDKSTAEKAKMVEEAYAKQGKPTPTQEENDLAKAGVPVEEHEDDGSGPEMNPTIKRDRQIEAKPGGGYGTRGMGKEHNNPSPSPTPAPKS